MKKNRKISVLSVLLLMLTGCSGLPEIVRPKSVEVQPGVHAIYIVSHGWHTGVIVPAGEIQNRIPQLKQRFSYTPFLEFGWGDKGFYQAEEITSSLTLRAIFWPTESIVHVVAVPDDPHDYFSKSEVVRICLNKNELDSLLLFIENSFYKKTDKTVDSMKDGIYGDSQFYKGVGDYYLMNTCNTWTARALASSGFDINAMFKLTSASVMNYIEDNGIALADRSRSCALKQ